MENYITCGQAARQLRVSISTLKRWVQEPDLNIDTLRNHNGWRLFSGQQMELLKEFKRKLKRGGKRFTESTLLPIGNFIEKKPIDSRSVLKEAQ